MIRHQPVVSTWGPVGGNSFIRGPRVPPLWGSGSGLKGFLDLRMLNLLNLQTNTSCSDLIIDFHIFRQFQFSQIVFDYLNLQLTFWPSPRPTAYLPHQHRSCKKGCCLCNTSPPSPHRTLSTAERFQRSWNAFFGHFHKNLNFLFRHFYEDSGHKMYSNPCLFGLE